MDDGETSFCEDDASDDCELTTETSGAQGLHTGLTSRAIITESKPTEHDKWEDVASFLLRHNLLLTALEYHMELVEMGKELPRLRDFFTNPGNFEKHSFNVSSPVMPRTSSIQTFDSLDFTRYSDDADRQLDERVAVLEFELRKAKETIKALRANLTIVAESDPNSPENIPRKDSVVDEGVKPHEKRALNFLINEYLLKNQYKLTSITFADENEEQDFDDWDDVGLNTCRPPELPQVYRQHWNKTQQSLEDLSRTSCRNITCQTEVLLQDYTEDKATQTDLQSNEHIKFEEPKFSSSCEKVLTDFVRTPSNLQQFLESIDNPDNDQDVLESAAPEVISPTVNEVFEFPEVNDLASHEINRSSESLDCSRSLMQPCGPFVSALQKECFPNRADLCHSSVSLATNHQELCTQLSTALPIIIPSVLLAKRGELVPLILSAVCLQTETKECDKLLNLLFNLIKKPEEEERQLILSGMDAVARFLGSERVEAELLPQCWEQIGHKYVERRLLVAECCGVLLPYLSDELCGSLVLSMIQQMLLEEKEESVRAVLIRSLAALLPHIHQSHKYTQVEDLLFTLLEDEGGGKAVEEACLFLLLPSLAYWTLKETNRLRTSLLARTMQAAQACLQCCQRMGPGQLISEIRGITYVRAIEHLCPFLLIAIVREKPLEKEENTEIKVTRMPSSACCLLDAQVICGEQFPSLLQSFDNSVGQEWFKMWPALDWVLKTFIPWIEIMVESCKPSQSGLVQSFCQMLRTFCNLFGRQLLDSCIQPVFLSALRRPNSQGHQESGLTPLSSALVPTYAAGVLAAFEDDESKKALVALLEEVLVALSLQRAPLDSLSTTFTQLCSQSSYQDPLLSVLWKGVVHGSALVRSSVAKLFDLLIPLVDNHILQHRIMPALITLASDPDMEVRASVVPALGSVFEVSSEINVQEKVRIQLQSFLDDPSSRSQQALLTALIRTFTRLGTSADQRMRDEFILPRLAAIAVQNNQSANEDRKQEIAIVLFEAYSALSTCSLSGQMIAEVFLPGLMCLQHDFRNLPPGYSEALLMMVRELEARLMENKVPESPTFAMGSAVASMEDVRNRVTKMFGSKTTTNRPNLPSIFQLRKK